MIDYPTLMMRSFVVIVDQHRKAQGIGQREFGRKCWPEAIPTVAAMRWQAMRTKSRNSDKPQGVPVFDAQRMASALNIDLSYLMLESTSLAQDIMRKSPKSEQVTEKNDK